MDDLFGGTHIIVCSRKQAIEDGIQVNLSERYPNDCTIYKFPVFCTKRVWDLIESAVKNEEASND